MTGRSAMNTICEPDAVTEGYEAPFGTACPYVYPELIDGWQEGQCARFFDNAVFAVRPSGGICMIDGRLLYWGRG